jgi:hypothetical protein
MLNQAQRQAVFDGIPDVLCGITLPKQISDQYTAAPNVPGIEITYLTQGTRARWSSHPIRCKWNSETKDFDEEWGQMHSATLSIAILSHDKKQLFNFAADMLMQIFRDRLGLNYAEDRVKFIDVISQPILTSERLEPNRMLVHRAHIDIKIEYEVNWTITEPSIKRFSYTYNDAYMGMTYEPGAHGISMKLIYGKGIFGVGMKLVAA